MNDNANTPTEAISYENTADPVWAHKALDLYRDQHLKVQTFDTNGVVSAQVWGPCPRCGHSLNVQETLTTTVPGLRGGWWAALTGRQPDSRSGIPDTVEVGCGCDHAHPGAPTQGQGCGVSFRLPTTPAAPATPSPTTQDSP